MSHPYSNASFVNIWGGLIWRRSPNLTRSLKLVAAPRHRENFLGFYRTKDRFGPGLADIKHDYTQQFYQSYSSFISQCPRTGKFRSVCAPYWSAGRGRHWNFDPLQCLGPRPEILDRYISLSCLRWLPTACHERLAYFHWPQWVTWLVTWWVTWARWPDAGRHIGKFSLWTTLLRFSRSAQISLFSNFTKLGQLFFDNIFFGLTS